MSALRAVVVTNFNDAAIDKYFRGRLGGLGIQVSKVWKLSDVTKMAQGNLPIPPVEADGVVYSIGEVKNGRVVELRNWLETSGLFCVGFAHKNRDTTDFMRLIELERDKRASKPVRNALHKLPEPEVVPMNDEVKETKAEVVVGEVDHRAPNDDAKALTVIEPFDFRGHAVRVYDRDGKTVWVAKDVCETLGLANVSKACESLKEGSEKGSITLGDRTSRGGNPNVLVLTEPGLYQLVFKSTKPEAEAVKKWLSHDVLPALRRKGYYIMGEAQDATPSSQVQILEALLSNAKQVEAHESRIAQLSAESVSLAAQQEADRAKAEAEAKAAMQHADDIAATIPEMVKKAVDERPPLRTPLQQPLMRPGVPMTLGHRGELRLVVGNICTGYATLFAPSGTEECAANELFLRETTWRIAGNDMGHTLMHAPDELYENWLRVIPVAADKARQVRDRMRTLNRPLPPSYTSRIKSRVPKK